MTHTFYHTKLIGGNGKSKELGTFGKITSAHNVVDKAITRLINKHKRNLCEPPKIELVKNDEGVHTFIRLTVKAHQFRRTVHQHHFLVTEEEMKMSREKPIKTYQVQESDDDSL